MKLARTKVLYDQVCTSYLRRKPPRTTTSLEHILFLLQVESLHENKVCIPYPIYIEGTTIKIPFISDMLQVTRCCELQIGYGRKWFGGFSKDFYDMCEYNKLSLKYKKMTDQQLQEKVAELINSKALNPTYFIKSKYKNTLLLKYAHYLARTDQHPFKTVAYMLFTFIILWLVIAPILLIPIIAVRGNITLMEISNLIYIELLGLLLLGVWGVWTKRWLQPTEYEKHEKKQLGD